MGIVSDRDTMAWATSGNVHFVHFIPVRNMFRIPVRNTSKEAMYISRKKKILNDGNNKMMIAEPARSAIWYDNKF